MTNQAILSIFDYLCNEARNSAHSLFGLTELEGETAADLALRACIEGSRASTDRLLRSIDDVRELLAGESPASETLEEFDAALCLGETVDLLNLASRQPGRRIVLESGSEPVIVRQDRRVMEQVLARVLDAGLKLIRSGELRAGARPGTAGNGVRFEILLPICDLAARLVEWLNVDPEQIAFQNNDDVALKVPVMVAGRRLRALGGTAEFACQAPAPTRLAIYLPSQPDHRQARNSEPLRQSDHAEALNVLVAEDCDESYAISELLLKKENVWRARTGLEAIDVVKSRRFDLVLMDVHMPGMDGYEAIRLVRDWETQTGNARTPIVVASSDDLDKQHRSAAQAGCSGFLRKPLRKAELLELLDRLKAARAVAC
jgi:CheY-like chemotaxis protein